MISLLLTLSLLSPFSVERCANGLDDDGDGLIDLNDPDCHCSPLATPSGPELIFNGGFELLNNEPDCQGCVSLYDSDNCPQGWLQESVNLHTPCFTAQQAAENIGYISTQSENYQGVGGYGSNPDNNTRIQEEFLQTTLLAPLTAGQTYRLGADLDLPTAFLTGINIVSTHQLVILGSELDHPGAPATNNCYEDSQDWIKLGSLDFRNNLQDVFQPYSTSFVAPGPIRHLLIASACCQADTLSAQEALTYWAVDNLSLQAAEAEPLEAEIAVQAADCTQPMVLCVTAPANASVQWYREGIALVGETQLCLSLASNTFDGTVFQCLITTEDNCGLAATTIQRDCDFSPENCLNGLDDDGDGLTDLNDPDCSCLNTPPTLEISEAYCPTNIVLSTTLDSGQLAQWYYNGTAIPNEQNQQLVLGPEADLLGQYTVVIVGDSGCAASLPFQAQLPGVFDFVWDFEVARCHGDSNARISIHLANDDPENYIFSWKNETGASIGDSATLSNIPAGNYRLELLTADSCSGQFNFTLPDPPPPSVNYSLTLSSCTAATSGATLLLFTENMEPPVQHGYYSGADLLPIETDSVFLENGQYTGRTIDANGCGVNWGPVIIDRPAVPDVRITAPLYILNLGETLPVQIITNAVFLENSQWLPPEITDCPTCWSTTILPLENTLLSFSAFDPGSGCFLSDSVFIRINAERNFYAPNAFSPNQDGLNDRWKLFGGIAVASIGSINIFDRWGSIVYQAVDNEGWNGKVNNGKDAHAGTYIFTAEILFIDGSQTRVTGEINLIRD